MRSSLLVFFAFATLECCVLVSSHRRDSQIQSVGQARLQANSISATTGEEFRVSKPMIFEPEPEYVTTYRWLPEKEENERLRKWLHDIQQRIHGTIEARIEEVEEDEKPHSATYRLHFDWKLKVSKEEKYKIATIQIDWSPINNRLRNASSSMDGFAMHLHWIEVEDVFKGSGFCSKLVEKTFWWVLNKGNRWGPDDEDWEPVARAITLQFVPDSPQRACTCYVSAASNTCSDAAVCYSLLHTLQKSGEPPQWQFVLQETTKLAEGKKFLQFCDRATRSSGYWWFAQSGLRLE